MKHLIIGTAGHIDHGKTALVKSLTGTDTDRLPEEKSRGISIELGFAEFLIEERGIQVGIVDVPGHEKFIKQMLAGATGIDIVLLIIASDEGIMPQTREHFEIIKLLNVKNGIIVLTKIDLVDDEWLGLIKEDVKKFLKGTIFESAPIVEVSSITGKGLPTLKEKIAEIAEKTSPRSHEGAFRLPVDRVFTIKGFGTTITGTTLRGKINVGDEVEIFPKCKKTKVRSIQVHNKEVNSAFAGERTAISLHSVEKTEIERGDVISIPDYFIPTYLLDAKLNFQPPAGLELIGCSTLKNNQRIRFHLGTAEILGRIILLDKDELKPGDSAFVQFHLESQTIAEKGDRFIIRSYSPMQTIGGGIIISANPRKHKRFDKEVIQSLDIQSREDFNETVLSILHQSEFKGKSQDEIKKLIPEIKEGHLTNIIDELKKQGKIIPFGDKHFLHYEIYNRLKQQIISIIEKYHKEFYLRQGISKAELKSKLPTTVNTILFESILLNLSNNNEIKINNDLIGLSTHEIKLSPDLDKLAQKIEKIYLDSGYSPPEQEELYQKLNQEIRKITKDEKILDEIVYYLMDKKILVKVSTKLVFHKHYFDKAVKDIIEHLKSNGKISMNEVKEIIPSSRKYVIPLMEYMDRLGITKREGDVRVLGNNRNIL